MSKLFPQLDRRLTRRLLRNGMRVSSHQTDLRQAAAILENLGLITMTRRQYLKCVNQTDDDYLDVVDPDCEGIIELDVGPYTCPNCGRPIEYPGVEKEVFEDLRITLRREGIADYLFEALGALDIVATSEQIDQKAAKAVLSDGRALIVPIVDYAGPGWRASDADAQKIHVYVIASPINRPGPEYRERAYHLELADILFNDQAWLTAFLDIAAQPGRTAFISYAHRDASFVARLAEDLVASGVGVWLDRWEIKVGHSISDRIQEGIQDSDYLVIVLSPNSVNSSWVREELNAARIRQLESRQVVVLPVLYQDCEIPPLLKDKRYADCRGEHYEQGLQGLLDVLAPLPEADRPLTVHWGREREKVSGVIPDRRLEPVLDRKGLLLFICDRFDDEELRTLCFILDVPYDDLPAQGRKAKARELIKRLERQDRLNELLIVLNQERPDTYTKSGLPTVT
jgi:hypothetical protein